MLQHQKQTTFKNLNTSIKCCKRKYMGGSNMKNTVIQYAGQGKGKNNKDI